MLTGPQISQARALLGWFRGELSRKALLEQDVVDPAEERDRTALPIYGHEIAMRRMCEQVGVEVVDHSPSARLREDRSEPSS